MKKRLLSLIVAMNLILVSIPFTFTANASADTSHIKYEYIGTERDSVPFVLCDSVSGFLVHTGDELSIDRQNKVDGIASVDYKIFANNEKLISLEYSTERPVDARRYTHIEMDIYLDSIDFISDLNYARMVLDSVGKSGIAEISFDFFSGLTTGWNHVKIDLADAKYSSANNEQFDITHVNYLLIKGVTNNALVTTLNIKLDNIYFTNGNGGSVANVPVTMGESAVGFIAGANGYSELDKTNKVAGNGSVKYVVKANTQQHLACKYIPADYIDASGLTHLEFDLYLNNATTLSYITDFQVELGSAGEANTEEVSFNIAKSLKAGWNHIKLSLNEGIFNSSTDKDFDITHVNYFNFYATLSGSVNTDIQLNFDNVEFTDGNGVTVYLPKSGNYKYNAGNGATTYRLRGVNYNNTYVSDSIPDFGDMNNDQEITANDALIVLQGSVDAIDLTNAQLIKADVDNNHKIATLDALRILQHSVGSINTFAAETALSDYASAPTELGFTTPSLVHTKYYTNHAVVAEVDVTGFGAYGDGEHDDYEAFQAAINEVGYRGGGSVFVPVGTYKISHALYIPNGVTLVGDNPIINENGTGKTEGTVLYAYSGRNLEDGENFIQLDLGAGVHNLSIYYPEQDPNNIVPYSYTIKQTGHYGRSVNNVNFVNSYNGIQMGTTINALQNIINVSGTILNNGINLDQNVDICRMEGLYFSPKYWINSGLETIDSSSEQNIRNYIKNNAVGLTLQQIDWVYLSDVYIDGMNIAAELVKTDRGEGGPNGQFYNFNATNCYTGITCDYLNSIGMIFTKGTISAEYPFICGEKFQNSLCINSMNFKTTGPYAIKSVGSGDITIDNCTFKNESDTPSGTGIYLSNGSFSATNSTIENFATDVQLTGTAKGSMLVNVNTEDNIKADDQSSLLSKFWDDEYINPGYTEMDYRQELITRPSADNFINLANYEYSGSTAEGIAGKLQAAIDELHALGGGMVYVPAGRYTLEKNIVVKSGVEVRGSATNPHHNHVRTTVFYTEYGRHAIGENKEAANVDALFTLESKAGLSGFKVARANQYSNQTFVPYAYTVRGNGFGVYVNNVSDLNPFYGIDFATNKCDGHVVNGFDGAPLEVGVAVGGGSAKGVVKNCQLICHFYYDGDYVGKQNYVLADALVAYQKMYLDCFVVKDTNDQILFNNFAFGTHNGLLVDEGADAFVLTLGIDASNFPVRVRGESNGGKVDMVNTQLAIIGSVSEPHYVEVEETYDGVLTCVQTNMWGYPQRGIDVRGGKVTFTQGTVLASGNFGVRVYGDTELKVSGIHHRRNTGVFYDIFSNDGMPSLVYFANRYLDGEARPRVDVKYLKTTDF